jgi:carbonic anhydrase
MSKTTGIERLIEGNRRFYSSRLNHPDQDAERRKEISGGQHPFAAIVGCSDSRVPPEIVFDQGLGDLFVVRLAGNVLDDMAIGSLEYAVEHLHVPLIVVLGHTSCGAINAAMADSGGAEGFVGRIISAIRPSIDAAGRGGADANEIARVHAKRMADLLVSASPILKEEVTRNKLTIVSARYDLSTGVVEVFA